MTHLRMSYTDCRRIPIVYRRWFIDRIVKDVKRKKEAISGENTIDQDTGPSVSLMGQKRFV
jgi:hypothetical protein